MEGCDFSSIRASSKWADEEDAEEDTETTQQIDFMSKPTFLVNSQHQIYCIFCQANISAERVNISAEHNMFAQKEQIIREHVQGNPHYLNYCGQPLGPLGWRMPAEAISANQAVAHMQQLAQKHQRRKETHMQQLAQKQQRRKEKQRSQRPEMLPEPGASSVELALPPNAPPGLKMQQIVAAKKQGRAAGMPGGGTGAVAADAPREGSATRHLLDSASAAAVSTPLPSSSHAALARLDKAQHRLQAKMAELRARAAVLPKTSKVRVRESIPSEAISAIQDDLRQLELHSKALEQKRATIVCELNDQASTSALEPERDVGGASTSSSSAQASLAELHGEQVDALLAQLSLGGAGGNLGGWSRPAFAGLPLSHLMRPDDTSSEASYFTSRWLPTDLT